MTKTTLARLWFACTAAVILIGLIVQFAVSAGNTAGHFATVGGRLFNVLCYFTIESNIMMMAVCALLALDPDRDGPVFRVFRLAGVLGITVTGIVFHTVLAGLADLQGAAAFADFMLHTASPLLSVAGWLAFGPRGRIETATIGWAAVYPLLYLAFTLARGPMVDFYPYPFLDVRVHGYGMVALNSVGVAVLFLGLAWGARALDRILSGRAAAAEETA